MSDQTIDATILKSISTAELSKELESREAVHSLHINPFEEISVKTGPTSITVEGPAILIVNYD